MPKFFHHTAKALAPGLAALGDRPLIWLLPPFLAGIALGWERPAASGSWELQLILCAALALAALLGKSSFWRNALLLAPAALLLGWGLCARSLAPPEAPDHILNALAPEAAERTVIVSGVLLEGSDWRPGQNHRLLIEARELLSPGEKAPEARRPVRGKLRVTVGGGQRLWVEAGDALRLPVILRRVRGFKNPGADDYERYWAAQGVWVSGFVKSPALVTSWAGGASPWLSQWRQQAVSFIEEKTSAPVTGLLAAQLLGRRSAVDQESEEVYRRLGLTHILSVSGLHLSVWYGLCFWLLRRLLGRVSSRAAPLAALLALIPALGYAALAGAASPVIRSAVMIAAVVLAAIILRRSDPWNILAAAAWLLLMVEPYRLFSASFQLSFAATAAMLAVFVPRPGAPRLAERPEAGFWTSPLDHHWLRIFLRRIKIGQSSAKKLEVIPNPRPRPTSVFYGALLAALAGTLGTAPLVLRHFGRLSWAGVPANVLFTGLLSAFVLMPGLVALALLPLSPSLAAWPLALAAGVQAALMPLMEHLAQAAGPGQLWPSPSLWCVGAWFAAGWVWLRSPRPWKFRLAMALAILAVGIVPGLALGPGERGVLRVTVLDVGQGSSIHINFPDGRQMLVDGGGSYRFDPGERLISTYLRRRGLSRLDVMVLSHPDLDHLRGLVSLAQQFRPRELWDAPWPEDFSPQYQEFRHVTINAKRAEFESFDKVKDFGGARVRLLWPLPETVWPSERPSREWVNDHGLVLRVEWGEVSFLITGDVGPEAEAALVARYGRELQSTVVTAPHHGEREALGVDFLKATAPEWITFSVGRNNAFGHPHPETLKRARASGANIRRTDLEGAAVFEVFEGDSGPVLKARPPL